ncbi:MAG: condensation domain-containing protein, partial [Desulfobacterales bacterium]
MDPESIETRASFMDLGADSLTFTDVLFKIEDTFQMEIPVEKFFDELSTLSALCDYILANMSLPEAANSQALPARFQGRSLPLSDRQHDVWQLSQVSADGHLSNNELSVLRFNISVDVDALQSAFQAVVDRHEALRTFISADGTQQTVLAALPVALQQTDFSHCSPETRETEIIQWIRRQRRLPFDLSCAPLWRTAILKSDASEYLLVLIVHHILFDGLSFEVFFKDLLHGYTAITAGRSLQLPDPMQYREFVALETARQVQPGWGAQKYYWHAALANPPSVADLPLDAARPPEMTYRGSCYAVTLDRELAEALKAFSRQAGTSLFMTLLAGYFTLLHRLTGRQDLIISINLARRNYKTARHMIGYCSDMMAVRHRLEGNVPFNELLQKIKKTVLAIFKHQDYPFCHLYKQFGTPDSSRNGLLTSMFALQRATAHSEIAGACLDLNEKAVTHSKMDFYANIVAIKDSLRVQFMYNPDLFRAETVARWMSHFVALLGDIVQYPAKPVYALALLTAAENKQLLAGWNDTRKAYPVTATFKDLF